MVEDIQKIFGFKIPWGGGNYMPGSVSLIFFLCLVGKLSYVKKFEVATQAFLGLQFFQNWFLMPGSSMLG